MSQQSVGPLAATELTPSEATLSASLDLALVVLHHHRELIEHGYSRWRTAGTPILFGSAALAAVLQLESTSGHSDSATDRLSHGVLLPTSAMPVEIYVPEVPSNEVQLSDSDSDGANAQAHLPHFDLWKRIEDKHNQYHGRPLNSASMRWTAQRAATPDHAARVDLPVKRLARPPCEDFALNFRQVQLRLTHIVDPQGHPSLVRFRVPEHHVLLFDTCSTFIHSNLDARRVAFFRLLLLTEFPSFRTNLDHTAFDDLVNDATVEQRENFWQVEESFNQVFKMAEIHHQVNWHMRLRVTTGGAGTVWNAEDLTGRYLRCFGFAQSLLTTAVMQDPRPARAASIPSEEESLSKHPYVPHARSTSRTIWAY